MASAFAEKRLASHRAVAYVGGPISGIEEDPSMLLRRMRVLKLATFMEAFSTAGRMSALQMRDGYIAF